MAVEELDICETCHECNQALEPGASVIVVAFQSERAPRVLVHVHCAARVAAKIRANE